MNLNPNKKLYKNLKLLYNCSLVRIIELTESMHKFMKNDIEPYLQYLASKDSKPFRDYLQELSDRRTTVYKDPKITFKKSEDFLDFLPDPTKDRISPRFSEQCKKHSRLINYLNSTDKTLQEHYTLNEILQSAPNDLGKLQEFLSNANHSRNFQIFSDFMNNHSSIYLSYNYRNRAKKIALDNNLYKDKSPNYLEDNLGNTFNANETHLALNRDFSNRVFRTVVGIGASVIGLAAAVNMSIPLFHNPDIETPNNPSEGTQLTDTTTSTENEPTINIEPPISNSITINSYETASEDFYQKTAEVYKYNTGKDIDLSHLDYNDIYNSNSTIFIVNYNGKTYRFSSQSQFDTNLSNLKSAFSAVGANFTTEESEITYIYDNGDPIAIVDRKGNAIKSGNILQESPNGSYEMFNPIYVNTGKTILEANGIDTSGMSEAELVGHYILSPYYNIQNDDLSAALGETSGLGSYIARHFKKTANTSDERFVLDKYIGFSTNFSDRFNEAAINPPSNDIPEIEYDVPEL